ncbi:MAG: sugar ABC transporter permease [Thermotogae bacterium]|nr:MAG: sugar ABC transporter permease [Thermotogota bacterium]
MYIRKKISRIVNSETGFAYLVLIPIVVLIFFMAYLPAIQSFCFSLKYYNVKLPWKTRFTGLNNYMEILKDPGFWQAFWRSCYFVVISVSLILSIAMGFALTLNQNFKGRSVVRTLIMLPWAIPPVVNGFIWKWFLNGDYGFLNGLLYQLGIISKYRPWLADPFSALNWAIVTFVWRFTPFVTILLLGALQSIPPEIYDASKVDGADAKSRFFYITLPLIRPTLVIAMIVIMIYSFTVFDEIYTLTGLDPATKTLMMYDYELTFEKGHFGLGSALAYLIGIFMFVMAYFYIKAIYREVER